MASAAQLASSFAPELNAFGRWPRHRPQSRLSCSQDCGGGPPSFVLANHKKGCPRSLAVGDRGCHYSQQDDADYDHLQTALAEITVQDPSVRIEERPHQKLFILQGKAKADLQSIYDLLRDEYDLAVNVGLLDVVFLETIRKQSEGEGTYILQTGGLGNYGHCKLRVEPNEPGKGYEFINDIKCGVVPKEYIKPIDQGVQGAMELGILAGFEMVDIKVTLFDGSFHEVDSNEMAFSSLLLWRSSKR